MFILQTLIASSPDSRLYSLWCFLLPQQGNLLQRARESATNKKLGFADPSF
jgi:hypothetical protein